MNSAVVEVLDRLQKLGKLPAPRRRGKNYIYDCPFHSPGKRQDTASFGVHSDTGEWNCFGCHRRGPSIDALYSVLTGIPVKAAQAILPRPAQPGIKDVLAKLKVAALVPEPMEAFPRTVAIAQSKEATAYMHRRGIPPWVWDKLGLLYACANQKLGRRIIFPMALPGGKVGFMGRAIDASEKIQKFRPISNLENYFYDPLGVLAPGGNREMVVVVEGEFSLAACVREKLPAVCPLGSSLGAVRLQMLYGFETVYSFFDGDEAGHDGTQKILAAARKLDPVFAHRIQVLKMPRGQDPATLPPGFGDQIRARQVGGGHTPTLLETLQRKMAHARI